MACVKLQTVRCLLLPVDHDIEIKFRKVTAELSKKFGDHIEVEAILVLIGIQELGQGHRKFSKDEKINLMHVGICTILEPWGIYQFDHNDPEGWPHFTKKRDIPSITDREQEHLLKEAIINYFVTNKIVEL